MFRNIICHKGDGQYIKFKFTPNMALFSNIIRNTPKNNWFETKGYRGLCKIQSPRSGVTLAYRVDEGVPEVQSSGVRWAGCARAPTAPATAATALEPQIHATFTHTLTQIKK